VRVIDEEALDPEGLDADALTPIAERFACPVCGTEVPPSQFRVESVGEVWLGDEAVWAEEGVCADCYREVVSKNIREWTHAEWLVHHYEGWRTMVDSVHELLVFESSPQESWLPENERHQILDIEATLSARREHLARCQMAMEELQGRYDAKITPPPFQMTLASGSQALSDDAIDQLRARRDEDVRVETELRENSIYGVAPLDDSSSPGVSMPRSESASPSPSAGGGLLGRLVLAALVAVVLVALGLLAIVAMRNG